MNADSLQQNKRLSDLHVSKDQVVQVKKGYSWFVKLMRVFLPLIALGLILFAITLPQMKEELVIVPKEEIVQQAPSQIGENELLNPNFETVDSNQNPVKVTAARALHNQENPNLIKLDNPRADLKMNDGSNIIIQAQNGSYEQKSEKLYLRDSVTITHESGYQLKAQELRIDLKSREAFSDKAVEINGPAATISAVGLKGNITDGTLIFNGPTTLTLRQTQF
jgi:lipopolysaccharide export system protein LptC